MTFKPLMVALVFSALVPGIIAPANSHSSEAEGIFSTEEMGYLLFETVNKTFVYNELSTEATRTDDLSRCERIDSLGLAKPKTDSGGKWMKCIPNSAGDETRARLRKKGVSTENVPPEILASIVYTESLLRSKYDLDLFELLFMKINGSGSMLFFEGTEHPAQIEKLRYVKLLTKKGFMSHKLEDSMTRINDSPAIRMTYGLTGKGKAVTSEV